jgi:hypothetical protein
MKSLSNTISEGGVSGTMSFPSPVNGSGSGGESRVRALFERILNIRQFVIIALSRIV